MKRLFFALMMAMLSVAILHGTEVINGFDEAPADTAYWATLIGPDADSTLAYINMSFIADQFVVAPGAMRLDWGADNAVSWGGYTKLEHWIADSSATYDFSAYDTISFWYYNEVAQSAAGSTHLRFNLHDVSDSPEGNYTYDVGQCEYYYSFHYILDATPGWNQVKIPLVSGDFWGGEGFNRTGWAGISGNSSLDLDKIKGFSIEFSINTAADYSAGVVILDQLELRGQKSISHIFFNGLTTPSSFSTFAWGQSTMELVEGGGYTPELNALKWVQGNEWGNGWTGWGFNVEPMYNMEYEWLTDSLTFWMKSEEGVGSIRIQLEGGGGKAGYIFDATNDNQWHHYAFKLSDFVFTDGSVSIDTNHINVFGIIAEASGIAGKTLYLTEIWTGHPVLDLFGPIAVTGVAGVAAANYNIVTWSDVPEEEGEVYDVYASQNPITDLNARYVDKIASKVAEGVRSALHYLRYPLVDTSVQYYYAVVCTDLAGNLGDLHDSGTPVTNTAKGVPTISLDVPTNLVVDGDLNEWYNSGIAPFVIKPSVDNVTYGSFDNDNDLTGTVFIAIDEENIYLAIDVIDDNYVGWPATGNWWEYDAVEVYFGAYDHHGAKHLSLSRGAEPDFKMEFTEQGLMNGINGDAIVYTNDDANFVFEGLNPDYVIEAIIPFSTIYQEGDYVFTPTNGMRTPLELYFHDRDNDGNFSNVGMSPLNLDNAWQTPEVWDYTWIGDQFYMTGVEEPVVAKIFELKQNYPNPFNPVTRIEYSIPEGGLVTLDVYNVLGQRVATLINSVQTAGNHQVNFDGHVLASGVYFYKLSAGNYTRTMKMALMK